MEEADYLWLEEPMREFSLYAYERLCETLDISILGAECTDGCHYNASEWLRHGACDRLRTSWFYKVRIHRCPEGCSPGRVVSGAGGCSRGLPWFAGVGLCTSQLPVL